MRKPVVDVVVAGHRDHYGTPSSLDRSGLLRHIVTDLYTGPGSWAAHCLPLLSLLRPGLARTLSVRNGKFLPQQVIANNFAGVRHWFGRRNCKDVNSARRVQLRLAKELANAADKAVDTDPDAIVGYRMSDTLFRRFRGRSKCILCQNDGGIHELRVVRSEAEAFPEWVPEPLRREASSDDDWVQAEEERLLEEWSLADRIVCWSKWCQTCVDATSGHGGKCSVIPPACHVTPQATSIRSRKRSGLTVGFLGTLCIRKGFHHLVKSVADLSSTYDIKLVACGVNQIHPPTFEQYSKHIDYRGVIPSSDLPGFFDEIDILVLPSLSEGVPMVLLESLSHQTPVITTDRCGDVVRNDLDGLLVEPGSTDQISDALTRIVEDEGLLDHYSSNCGERIEYFSLENASRRWLALIEDTLHAS